MRRADPVQNQRGDNSHSKTQYPAQIKHLIVTNPKRFWIVLAAFLSNSIKPIYLRLLFV